MLFISARVLSVLIHWKAVNLNHIKNARIIENFIYNGPLDLSQRKDIGQIKMITMDMEVSFEMKIKNLGSIEVDGYKDVLYIGECFEFGLRKSAEESKYYLYHEQDNGLEWHNEILKSNPISFSNNWKKEFLEIILKTQWFKQIYCFGLLNEKFQEIFKRF